MKSASGPISIRAGAQSVDFTLRPDVTRLSEVVVTGVSAATEQIKVPFAVARVDTTQMPVVGGNAVSVVGDATTTDPTTGTETPENPGTPQNPGTPGTPENPGTPASDPSGSLGTASLPRLASATSGTLAQTGSELATLLALALTLLLAGVVLLTARRRPLATALR